MISDVSTLAIPVVVVGSANIDSTYFVDDMPLSGETVLATRQIIGPGGKGANQAAGLAALGIPVELVCAVGGDDKGQFLTSVLRKSGVLVQSMFVESGAQTGSAVILVSQSGDNLIVVLQGANGFLSAERVRSRLSSVKEEWMLAQLEVPLEVVLAAARSKHGKFILNPAPMTSSSVLLAKILAETDILVPNRHELAMLAKTSTPWSVDEVVLAARRIDFLGQVVVTLGGDGAVCFPEGVNGEATVIPAHKVQAIDTSGAGDAFCSALAAALSQGECLVEATRRACIVGGWSVTQPGAQISGTLPREIIALFQGNHEGRTPPIEP